MRPLDPRTASAEDLAEAMRSLKLANQAAIAAAVVVAFVTMYLVTGSAVSGSPLAIVAITVASAIAYHVTYDVLRRILPPK